MIISRTPFRISFFGGGTDYPDWYREHGGAVLSTTIDKYCYISVRELPPFFQHRFRLVYSFVENVREISELAHPAARGVLQHLGISKGLEIHHDGDLPARSGVGSSSAFTVGLISAIRAFEGRHVSKDELAQEAIHVEHRVICEPVGAQDQISAAFGGFNHITFRQDGSYQVAPLIVGRERLDALHGHLMLLFTGLSRTAAEIARTQIENLANRASELHALNQMVDRAIEILRSKSDLTEFGRLLDEGWALKRRLSDRVSTPDIDAIYETACRAGAIGGKLLGAGGGGFVLLFVRPENRAKVRAALPTLLEVPFRFETSGSRIVLYQPDGW
jgi:D-glycero-alpha-D-manno-heptose-7-phosphate kinase